MLQQTTVAAVIPYFERFLARFPDVTALAAADEQEVLRLWEGLGYYSRARNLHRAARAVVERHGGAFPDDVPSLLQLPGIGRYTAGAIASFAFDQRAPIVEANTLRLYARLIGLRDDPRTAAGQKALWDFARRILPRAQPGRFNQALMDLGAMVCTPAAPDCARCPVQSHCAAFANGWQREIPVAAKRPEVTEVTHIAAAVEREGRWLLRQCGPGERWAGLWDFPRVDVSDIAQSMSGGGSFASRSRSTSGDLPRDVRSAIESGVEGITGIAIRVGEVFHRLRHSVTRYRIDLWCCRASCREETERRAPGELPGRPSRADVQWVATAEFESLPLSVTGRKLAREIERSEGR